MITMDVEKSGIESVSGAGEAAKVSGEELTGFKREMESISRAAGASINERRRRSDETRFCIWEGQSADGKKHAEAAGGAPVDPYEGASDGRLRVADMVVNERVLVMIAAGMRALMGIKANGMEIHDEALGGRLTTVLRWVLKNKMSRKSLRRELKKVANYQEGDSPAVGILGVWWKQEVAVGEKVLRLEEVAQFLLEEFQIPLEMADQALKTIRDPEQEEDAVVWLTEVLKSLYSTGRPGSDGSPGSRQDAGAPSTEFARTRVRQIVRDLRESEDGEATFPCRYWRVNHPQWTAYRMLEDIFVPKNTPADLQRARVIFLREWLSKPELEEREHSMDYTREFIDEVLKHEGKTGFPLHRRPAVTGDGSQTEIEGGDPESRSGLFEVVTAFFRASNEDGVPGIYDLPFSYHVEFAAKERELLDYKHGKYPFVDFQRETINNRLWDSRGVPELVMTEQNALKDLHDSFVNNVSLKTLPPFEVPANRPRMRLMIKPLGQVKVNRTGEIKPMQMPDYPMGNDKQQAEIWRRLNEFLGRFAETTLPMLTQLHQQGMADDFLDNLIEACEMTLDLCQQFMTDEELQLVSGAKGAVPVARSIEEIQGEYNLQMDFSVGTMDMAYIKELAAVIGELILPMDTESTIMRARLVQFLFQWLNPNLAEETLQPVESASNKEIEDEQSNFAKIAAGVEPPMQPQGQNFQLRLKVLQEIAQKNPEALEKLSPVSRQILEARMQQLSKQVEQTRDNPVIGRALGKPVLG